MNIEDRGVYKEYYIPTLIGPPCNLNSLNRSQIKSGSGSDYILGLDPIKHQILTDSILRDVKPIVSG